jgi:hypothetical protein
MARYLLPALALTTSLLSVACGGSSSQGGGGRTTQSGSGGAILADAPTSIAGDTLRARLPRGTLAPADATPATPGMLTRSVHVVQRAQGNVSITAVDTARSAPEEFATRVVDLERRARCAETPDGITPVTSAPAPAGLEVVVFTPETACPGATPAAARLWVKTADASVISITFECSAAGCMPDRAALVDAFIGSLTAGVPTPAPAGTRSFGPTPELMVTVTVPEGFLVRASEGEGTKMFEVFKRRALGAPAEGVSFTFFAAQSPNAVRDDYAREGAHLRQVNGQLAGRRTRFVELTYDGTTERIGRTLLGETQLDVVVVGSTPAGLTELEAIVTQATVQIGAPATAAAAPAPAAAP